MSGKDSTTSVPISPQGCKGCDRPIHVDDMVACDQCNNWWHFNCAGVHASVSERSWICINCVECRKSLKSFKSTSSNARLRLRQLAEAKDLEDRIFMEKAERDRAYLTQKHQIETEIESDMTETSSSRGSDTSHSRRKSLHDWIVDQNRSLEGAVGGLKLTESKSSFERAAARPRTGTIPKTVSGTHPATPIFTSTAELPIVNRKAAVQAAQSIELNHYTEEKQLPHDSSQVQMQESFLNMQHPRSDPAIRSLQRRVSIQSRVGQSVALAPPSKTFGLLEPATIENQPMIMELHTTAPLRGSGSNRSVCMPCQPEYVDVSDQPQLLEQSQHIFEQAVMHNQRSTPQPAPRYKHTINKETFSYRPDAHPFPAHTRAPQAEWNGHMSYQRPLAPSRHSINAQITDSTQLYADHHGQPNQYHHATGQSGSPQRDREEYLLSHQPSVCQQGRIVQQPLSLQSVPAISAQQLAARQVVPRELPKFSGDPLEWPMFLQAFETTTQLCGIQPDENLARLQKCLVGSARDKVQSILTLPAAVPNIIATLRDECGRPDQLVHRLLIKVRGAPHPNINKLDTLITFGREVSNLVTYIEAANLQAHLSNPMLLSELVAKLPPNLRLDWGLHSRSTGDESLKAFSDFVATIRSAACHVSMSSEFSQSEDISSRRKDKSSFINAHSSEESSTSKPKNAEVRPCPLCNSVGHRIRDCDIFKESTVGERRKLVDQHRLCQRCLVDHGKWPCRTKQPCSMNGCTEMHHRLLHSEQAIDTVSTSDPRALISTHHCVLRSTLFKIIPATLYGAGKTITTYVFLDDGSSHTLMDQDLADELGLDGENMPLCLQWTGNVTRKEPTSRQVNISISNIHGGSKYEMFDVRTVKKLDLPRQTLEYEQLSSQFPYLQGLPIASYREAAPRLLIGANNANLILTLARRERRIGEPVATKTRLGWALFGGIRCKSESANLLVHDCGCCQDDSLHELVKEYFAVDNLGITTPVIESAEDQRAQKILHESTKRTSSGKFETGLIWRRNDIEMPNSYPMAERRLRCLERRLEREPELRRKVDDLIAEYLQLGYAHIATEDELKNSNPKRTWYLPLGVVRNPRKPDKVRVVWDAAAKVNGISLNSLLLPGPDLLTPLLTVLCQFRQRQYAVSADIRQMFHQLLIKPEDRQVQRFLYRSDSRSTPTVYVLDVATFGATCSPCSAQYAKNLNAFQHMDTFPDAAEAIVKNTYVDDYLDSRDTIDEAVQLSLDVRAINQKAGFELRNWQSNSKEILRRIGEKCYDSVKNFAAEKSTPTERVLGMTWMTDNDVFVFSTQFREDLLPLLSCDTVPTKRQVLRVVMSYFDPLGIISNYTIHGRILLQDIWRSKANWDDPITNEDFASWQRWVLLAPQLTKVKIPRCYFPAYDPNSFETLQLHVFVDAGDQAYGAVAYFRIVDRGIPRCALVAAKAKVAPLKPLSTPRSELNASVIGIRLMKMIEKNHSFTINKRFLWTDSTTVLSWLHADPRKYRQYVALRVSEILSESEISEWYWIATSKNVADKTTKWGHGPDFDSESEWYSGPSFLLRPETEWTIKQPHIMDPPEELKAINVHRETGYESIIDFTEFSQLDSLLRKLAYLHHFRRCCVSKPRSPSATGKVMLNQEDYDAAEKSLWKIVQAQEFHNEIYTLKKNASLPLNERVRLGKSSPLTKLSPFIDEDGVLRLQSRIDPTAIYYAFNFRNPIVLPKQGHVTELLVLKYHQRFGHANVETVVNELRQRYYIPSLRAVVKSLVKRCMWCRVYRAVPSPPKMAALPEPRVQPYIRPFSFVGLDYFGPMLVKRGRTNVKRWVALFTCLTVRAVHLEVVHSLSTESCKMAIRRFIARRGAPREIFSDNGTNFRGAARELAEEIKNINAEVAVTFTNVDTKWTFTPPSAPHMGGVWERKVRSIKEAFKSLCHRDKLDDEEFSTFLMEAEMIVNSHPLTFVPLDEPNQEVLTPNCFLLMDSNGANNAPKIALENSGALRRNWKLLNHLLNQFWKTWIKAYLPTIARRTKWFNEVRPLQAGDLVIIVDEGVRNGWLRGRVIKVYPGGDGQVRKVDVQTDSGILKRAATKVALIDVQDNSKTNSAIGITGGTVATYKR